MRQPDESEAWARARALSHPLRVQLLLELRDGDATGAALARRMGQTRGNTSFHLRVLADAGLITEVDAGTARERWWRLDSMPEVAANDAAGAPDVVAFATAWAHERGRRVRLFAEELAAGVLSADRVSGTRLSELVLRLGPAEQQQLTAELDELLGRWEQTSVTADPPPDGRLVELQLSVFSRPEAP